MSADTFDTVIIGAGPGGYYLASLLTAKGERVALIERDTPGGTCLNRGCMPTKALAATAQAVLNATGAGSLGVSVQGAAVDYAAAHARMQGCIASLVEAVKAAVAKATLIYGEARITGEQSVAVADRVLHAGRIVIATGSAPAPLDIPGAELAISSDGLLATTSLPESMVIVGGGVIGMEFASIYAALGVKVTVLEYCKEILPPIDADTAKRLRSILGKRGIDIRTGVAVDAISRTDGGSLQVSYKGKRAPETVSAQTVLMAVGRRPVVPAGAVEAGVELSPRGFVTVDEYMRTSVPSIYAIGDVNGELMLAHAASAQARVIAYDDPAMWHGKAVPSVVYTYPEAAQVGMREHVCKAAGMPYSTVKRPYASNGKALVSGETDGFIKFVLTADGKVMGVSVVGAHAADLIAEATILVQDGVPFDQIKHRYIHAHPTLSELF